MSNEQHQVICPYCNNPTDWPAYCPSCKNYFEVQRPVPSGEPLSEARPTFSDELAFDVPPKAKSIGGWLVLPAIGLVLGPIVIIGALLMNISIAHGSLGQLVEQGTPGFRVAIVGQPITALLLLGLQLYAATLFFRKSTRLPKMMVILLGVNVLFTIINVAWTASVFQELTGAREIVQPIIMAGIWIPYFCISKRVAATFVNKRTRTDNIAGGILAGVTVLSILVVITLSAVSKVPAGQPQRGRVKSSDSAGIKTDPIAYEKDGLRFSHHSNWKITEDKTIAKKARQVNIESDDNAVFIILILPKESSMGFGDFAAVMAKERPAQIAGGTVSETKAFPVSRKIGGETFDGIRHMYSVSLLGHTIPNTQDFFQIKTEKANMLTTFQAPDEDWDNADKGFQVILDSLRFLSP